MKLEEVGQTLLSYNRSLSKKGNNFLDFYTTNFSSISESISRFPAVKGRLRLSHTDFSLDEVRFCTIMNDLSLITIMYPEESQWKMPAPGSKNGDFIGSEINFNITTKEPHKYFALGKKPEASPVFSMSTGPRTKRVISSIAPLIQSGRALVEPTRGIVTLDEVLGDGRKSWKFLTVDPDSPVSSWTARDFADSDSAMPLMGLSTNRNSEVGLYNITIPFISGIDFSDLDKVLSDEQHHIAKARIALRSVVDEASNNKSNVHAVVNEILRPELDKLSLRFGTLSSTRWWKQGAAGIGAVTLGLSAYYFQGIPQAVAAIAGAGGLGLFAKERVDSNEKLAALSESPYYLIWRLQQIQKG